VKQIIIDSNDQMMISLMENYEKGNLLDLGYFPFFPQSIRENIFHYLVYLKIYAAEIFKNRIPKLVVFYILSFLKIKI
jgi:hypothetical protein